MEQAEWPTKIRYRSQADAPTKITSGIFLIFFLKFFLCRVETFFRDVGGHAINHSEGARKNGR